MDERQAINAGKAALITLAVIALGAIGVLTVEYVQTKDVTNTAAVAVLLGSGTLFWAFERMFGAEAPRSLTGRELPTGSTDPDRVARRNSYLVDAALFAVAMTVLGLAGLALGDADAFGTLPIPGGIVSVAILGAIVSFGLMFGLNWLLGESSATSVEKRLARMEARA